MKPWNVEFERGLEVGTLRRVCRLMLADAFDHDRIAVQAVRWWMRPRMETLFDLHRELERATGISRRQHQRAVSKHGGKMR